MKLFVCLYNFIFICISFIENYLLSLFELGMCVCVLLALLAAWTLNFLSCIGASPFGSTLPNAGLKQTHTNRVANTKHSEAVAPSHTISHTDTYSIYLVYANGSCVRVCVCMCVCVKCISFCQSECIFLSTLTFPALRPCFPFFCSPSSIPHFLPLLHQLSLHFPWTLFGCSCHHSGSVLWRRLPPCCSSSVLRCCHFPFNEHFPFGFSHLFASASSQPLLFPSCLTKARNYDCSRYFLSDRITVPFTSLVGANIQRELSHADDLCTQIATKRPKHTYTYVYTHA